MQARAERLAGVNGHDRVIWGGNVFAPGRTNDDPANSEDRKLGAPAGCPLFGGDRSNEQWSDTAQANATTGERREAL